MQNSNSVLKLVPIGGMGNVTKNMFAYEQNNQILLVDCGIGFPDDNMLGIDLLIPDVSYLENKKQNIVGMILTHAHDDHIGGLPYILPKLGNFPIYASRLTQGFAQDRMKESKITANFKPITDNPFSVGSFTITPIKVTHSVPDARHFAIKTQVGTIYHGSDYKFDLNPVDGVMSQIDKIKSIGDQGVLCLLSDCLRSEKKGHSLSESLITETLQKEISGATGRVIITLMSSNIHRIQQAVDVAIKYHRQVGFIGRSVENNVKTAMRLGFLKIPHQALVSKKQLKKIPSHKLVIIVAGSQGQQGSSLERIASGEHRMFTATQEDKLIFASDAIPGNENPVYSVIDNFSHLGANVSYPDTVDNLHVSGHAYAGEQQQLIELTKPKFLLPIGGTYRHMVQYRKIAAGLGYQPNQVFLLKEGQTINFTADKASLGETIKIKNIMVDGLGIGDVGSIVLRDRQTMANEGIVLVIVPIEQQSGKITGKTEVISRGFVYMKQSKQLIFAIQREIKDCLRHQKGKVINWIGLRKKVETRLENFLYKKTQRRPLVLTVIMEV